MTKIQIAALQALNDVEMIRQASVLNPLMVSHFTSTTIDGRLCLRATNALAFYANPHPITASQFLTGVVNLNLPCQRASEVWTQ